MAHLRMTLFGPFTAQLGEHSLDEFESDKVRALLAYLAVETSHPHRRSTLAGLLWPDSYERTARASLRNALSNLRQVIHDQQASPRYLLCDAKTIQFNLNSDHWIDVQDFTEKITAGIRGKDTPDSSDHAKLLTEAVRLYQGNFLEGFSLRDSQPFEEWQLSKKEFFQQQALSAMRILVDYFEGKGNFLLASDYAQKQVNLAPWLEEAHRSLMRLYAKGGQRSLALEQFELCRRSLDYELDVQPQPETIELYDQIREGNYRVSVEIESRHHNLPAEISPLIGRADELVEIEQHLADRSCRLLTLQGPGGSGKTRLAVETARHQLMNYRDGVFIISLDHYRSIEAVTTAIARELGLSFPQGNDPHNMLLEHLSQKRLLLILDSFEHVPEAAKLVLEILQSAVEIKIIATSRERMNLMEEYIIPIGGLPYPENDVMEVNRILGFDAVQLFIECAQRLQPGVRYSNQDIDSIVSICRMVQGMPLAILLAASWCSTLSVPAIADELQKSSLDFLKTDWRDLPERQRSIQALFEYSYGLLNEDEQRIFVGLAIFQGGFNRKAALNIIGAELMNLKRLIDKTMLERSGIERFEIHELIHQFAQRKLALRLESDQGLHERFVQYYMTVLRDLAVEIQGSQQADAVHELLPDLPNLQTAWKWAVEYGRVDDLDMALDGLCGIYQWNGRFKEGATACQLAADHLKHRLSQQLSEGEACLIIRILAWQVYFENILGKIIEPKRNLELAFQQIADLDPVSESVRATKAFLLQQAGLYSIEKDYLRGWNNWTESLRIYRELGWRWREAQVLEYLGWAAPHQDAFVSSRSWLEESLSIRRDLGDQSGIASVLQYLAVEAAQEGDFDRMGVLVQESLKFSRALGTPAYQADTQYAIAVRLTYLGKFSEALIAIKETVRQYREINRVEKMASALSVQGWIEANLGLYQQGRATMEESLASAIQTNTPSIQAINYYGLGELQVLPGNFDLAIKLLRESIRLYRQMPQRDEMGMALSDLAVVEVKYGMPEQAGQDMREGITIAAQAGSWQAKVFVLINYACFMAELGDITQAVEMYALAFRIPYIANSRYWCDLAGKRIKELAAKISMKAVKDAEKRGEVRDLDSAFEGILAWANS